VSDRISHVVGRLGIDRKQKQIAFEERLALAFRSRATSSAGQAPVAEAQRSTPDPTLKTPTGVKS
jgi:hypothetical protein